MWLLSLAILAARPLARALNRLSRVPSLAYISEMMRSDDRAVISFSALATAELTSFETSFATGGSLESQPVQRVFHVQTSNQVDDAPDLCDRNAGVLRRRCGCQFVRSAAYVTVVVRSVLVECPLNVRVGANSPSRCPTIFSVMKIGM